MSLIAPVMANPARARTFRKQAILLRLTRGKSDTDVANDLGNSVRTVEADGNTIKRKLGRNSTAGPSHFALAHGVLQGTGV